MYGWIWRVLPGGVPGKLLGCAVLLTAAVALLFLVVFPTVEPLLPLGDVTVEGVQEPQPVATATP